MRGLNQRLRAFVYRTIFARPFECLIDRFAKAESIGRQGERLAERELLKQGCYVLARSYSISAGEVDLIAVDGQTVVFVEVKTRSDTEKGLPEDAVDDDKAAKISLVAESYIRRHRLEQHSVRFDIISIILPRNGKPVIKHYRAAFDGA